MSKKIKKDIHKKILFLLPVTFFSILRVYGTVIWSYEIQIRIPNADADPDPTT
jgi:hypothetical protein